MVGTKRRHDRGRLRIRVGLWSRAGHMTLLRIRVLAAAAAVGSLRALVRELRAPVRELRALVRETTLARILTLMGLTGPLPRDRTRNRPRPDRAVPAPRWPHPPPADRPPPRALRRSTPRRRWQGDRKS